MLARVQRRILLVCFVFASSWLLFCAGQGLWIWSFGGVWVLAIGYLTVLAAEFFLLCRVYRLHAIRHPRIVDLFTAYIREVPCALATFGWRQPFFSNHVKDSADVAHATGRGLVLVHGLFCNRGFWNPWLSRLRSRELPFSAVNLEPIFGSIDAYVAQIDEAVRSLTTSTGLSPVLVGHSMGGLAIRAWLAAQPDAAVAHHVMTIGSPHHGTSLARYSRVINGKQMRRGSPWLADLQRREHPARGVSFTCFWSQCDNIVMPTTSATLPGADNRHLPGKPHMAMAFHPAVFEEAVRLLGTP